MPAETTSFIGRRRELAEIRKKLTTSRLVSLVGPGGVGKTRLALRIATDLGRGFRDGAWEIQLAEVRDDGLVDNAFAAALDLRDQVATQPRALVLSYLKEKSLLLVVDNCEHLLESAARLVGEVMRAAPGVRVIATSREPLGIAGEQVLPVPPLELPSATDGASLSQLHENEAVMLFIDRASSATGSFELANSNRAAVVALCRRLDGLPLAIELAAVRTRVLSVQQIIDRLTDRFTVLTGASRGANPRHQTLQGAIDWSFDMLSAAEQAVLRRSCVFAGRFSLEDVEGICTSTEVPASQALNLLASLVDKSLVIKDDVRGLACYRLHETMREYALIKLREAHENDLFEERCLEYYRASLLASADRARYRLVEWLAWIELEIDNVRAVLHRCLARGDFSRGLDIAASMGYYWITRGTTESVRWFDQLLVSQDASPQTLMTADYLRGWLSMLQGDPAAARPWLAESVALARELGQLAPLSEALSLASSVEDTTGDLVGAQRVIDELEAIAGRLPDYVPTIALLQARAVHAFFQGDLATVVAASSEGVQLSREAGDLYQLESMLRNLGLVAMLAGDVGASKPRFVDALRVARQIDNRIAQYYLVTALGWHAVGTGQARLAARLLGAAETMGAAAGADIMGPFTAVVPQARQAAAESLGEAKFSAEFAAGKRLSRDTAVRLALGESDQVGEVAEERVGAGPLAKREVEVARLIAQGLSNKQIAARLFISEPTVATHVRHILDKLGFNSRAQIAGWIAGR